MDITNSKNFNINQTESVKNQTKQPQSNQKESDVTFSDELNSIKSSNKSNKAETDKDTSVSASVDKDVEVNTNDVKESDKSKENKVDEKSELNKKEQADKNANSENVVKSTNEQGSNTVDNKQVVTGNVNDAINGLNIMFDEINLLNQKDEMLASALKSEDVSDDNNKYIKHEDLTVIDSNMNIQEPQDKFGMQQMGTNMEFNSDAQPFSQFVKQTETKQILPSNSKDIEEEKSILSTMEENIAIANKNMAMSKTKVVENEHGVHKLDKKTNIIVDTIVSYDKVVMDKADVEFFTNLVENGIVDIKDVTGAEKSARVSKTLADMLLKAMNDNRPIRIDFDNDISVIIKIDRAGKISADFLPSSQVAEAYLKENLPLLRQRFDDNDIDYNELNQRQRKQENQDNRKKERKDE